MKNISEKFSQTIHILLLVFHKGMNIPFECDRWILVPKDFGQRLDIHPALNRSCGKGMTERMKSVMGYLLRFEKQFKATLIGPNGYHLVSVPYDVL